MFLVLSKGRLAVVARVAASGLCAPVACVGPAFAIESVLGSQLVLYVELRVGLSFPSPANKEFKIHGACVRNATFGDVVRGPCSPE